MVLTNEKYILTRGLAVWNTWGQSFSDIVFACNCPRVIAVKNLIERKEEIPKELDQYKKVANLPILNIEMTENVGNMGEKVLKVLTKSYNIYKNHSSFYYMVDDDAYVFVNNLNKYIKTLNTSHPHIYGFKFNHLPLPGGHIFGGSGILLTNESMQRLVTKIKNKDCEIHMDKYGDVTIGGCAYSAGIEIIDARDGDGKARFYAYDPKKHLTGKVSKVFHIFGSYNKMIGKECCSLDTIAFHYVKEKLMYEIHGNRTFLKDLFT